jgi:nitrogen regulatory protein P-II 1
VKLVIGIVRSEKANDVLEALYRAEVRGLSMSRVQGTAASSTGSRPIEGRP